MHLGAIIARVLALSLAACLLTGPAAAGDDPPAIANRLEVSAALLDLGEVEPSSTVRGSLTLHNIGRRAIGIAATDTSCSCTVASIEPRIAEPGESIRVSIIADAPEGAAEESVATLTLNTTEGQRIEVKVRVTTRAAIVAEVVGVAQLRDGQPACVIEARSLTGEPFLILGQYSRVFGPSPAVIHRGLVPLPSATDGTTPAVLRIETDVPRQPTLAVATAAALQEADIHSVAMRRTRTPARPSHVNARLLPDEPVRISIELPGWTDSAAVTRLAWTNPALALRLASLDLTPRGATAVVEIHDRGGGRRSIDQVTISSPSFESIIRITASRSSDGH